jgi:succinate dehydrogenase/fumarate reductase flavoprotein subunit
VPTGAGEESVAWIDRIRYADGSRPTAEIREEMQITMQTHAAVFRDEGSLKEGT